MPFLWFFFSMALGIVVADIFPFDFYISFFALIIILLIFAGIQALKFKIDSTVLKLQFIFPLLIFFQLGQTLYLFENPDNDIYHVENQYLVGDKVMVEIEAISKTAGAYKKCEVEAKYIIRYKDTVPTRGKILMFLEDSTSKLQRKQICIVNAELTKIGNNQNPGEFDSQKFWKHKSIQNSAFVAEDQFIVVGKSDWEIMDLFIGLREKFASILDTFLKGDENAVAKGLILGDRSSIDSEITRKFGNTGAMHVLAVSGLHVAILVQILTLIFGLFSKWISKNQALILALIIVWIYSALTGLSSSVVRSALMFTVLAGSTLSDRKYNGFNSLALSAVIILVWNPHFLFDIGFQLSYLAMVGIFLFNKHLSVLFYTKIKWIQLAWEGTMVGIAAQIMTVPLTLYYFHQFPNYFILTNLGLMIFSFLVLALGIGLFTVAWWNPLAKAVAFLLFWTMFAMLWIIDFVDSLPGAVSNGFVLQFWEVAFLFAVIIVFYWSLINQKIKVLQPVLVICILWIGLLVSDRFQRMNHKQICFFQAN
jgi:competence protein ComEC